MKTLTPHFHLLAILAVYGFAASVVLTTDSLLLVGVAWLVMGFILTGVYVLVHESSHNILFQSKSLNRILGTIAAMLTFEMWHSYRAWHWQHHLALGTEEDSEEEFLFNNKLDYVVQWLCYLPQKHTVEEFILSTDQGWREKLPSNRVLYYDYICYSLWLVVVLSSLVLYPLETLLLYIAPLLVSAKISFFIDVSEHYKISHSPDQFMATRTTVSNQLVRFFIWNANLHTAHHTHQNEPYYKLFNITKNVKEKIQNYETSYLHFHWKLFRSL